jgi:uncharacterized Zn finger protein
MGWGGGYGLWGTLGWGGGYGGGTYVSAAEKRSRAEREVARLTKAGRALAPVRLEGRKIAHTFWGTAWCDNLESYGDYANRLPRGRTYVRNGSVLDLQIAPGRVTALVSGSALYEVAVSIQPLERSAWTAIVRECSGKIDSVIELLAGRLSGAVMEVVSKKGSGLFPAPKEISLRCSCPDHAGMCKHVAATLYGVGARLDETPELLFTLRKVDAAALVEGVDAGAGLATAAKARVLSRQDLSSVFGIELADAAPPPTLAPKKTPTAKRRPARARVAATITAQTLIERGVPRPTIQGWLRQRVLVKTTTRGVYRVTPAARERLATYA